MDILLVFNKATLTKSVETLLWKYSNTIEGADNFKQVSNVRTDTVDDNADIRVLLDSFVKRTKHLASIMHEFVINEATEDVNSHNITIPIRVSGTWGGHESVLKSYLDSYVINGMMADWLSVTSPNEATIYIANMKIDEDNIISELYAVGGAI